MEKLSDIGERNLIVLARSILKEHHESIDLTDDCAMLPLDSDYLLVTSDMISEKTHIPEGMKPWQIGWFVTAINLSDIAAKGGSPLGILLSYGLPSSFPKSSFIDLVKGASSCANRYKTKIIGGDTKENDHIVISGTALGLVKREQVISRKGAKEADIVAVTGLLGKAAAGFYELKQKKNIGTINSLCEPEPRIDEGISLAKTLKVHCCMDLSDGLSSSLYQLAELNNCGFHLKSELLPISSQLHKYAEYDTSIDEEHLALHFGGDYELLLTADKQDFFYLQNVLKKHNTSLTRIGTVTKSNQITIDKIKKKNCVLPNLGYEHFSDKT